MSEVHLPGVGGVSKKALIIGGAASAALVGLFLWRKRSAGTATAAAADPSAADPNAGDYTDPGLQDTSQGPTYGATGYYDPNTGQWVFGDTGTGQAAATTNAAWSQDAISYLAGNSSVDTGALAAALGAYLAGRAVTTDQETLIDQAIAAEGYPPQSGPNGYPPGINVSSAGTGAGGTGGSTGGVTGAGGDPPPGTGGGNPGGGSHPITAKVSGLEAPGKNISRNSAQVIWHPLTPPAGQGPLTGYGVAAYDAGGHVVNGPFTVTNGQVFANIGGLKSRTTYHVNVWAEPARTGGPHASVSFTTK